MKQALLIYLLSFLPLSAIELDPDGNKIKEGYELYKKGDFASALKKYDAVDMNDGRLNYNKGTAYYKKEEYDAAIKEFKQALGKSGNNDLKKKAYYNLGNSFQKKGDKKNAASSYIESLKIDPDYKLAQKNLDLLNKKKEDKKDSTDQQNNKENQSNKQDKDNQEQKNKDSKGKKKDGKNGNDDEKAKGKDKTQKMTPEEKLKQETLDRIFKSSNPEDINRRKFEPEYGKKSTNFW